MIQTTACLMIIGNEILSGRTQDTNLKWLANALGELGISLVRAHIIRDDADEVVDTLNQARRHYDYVFTTGGIGPTHDDITTACVARAFGVSVVRDEEAQRRLYAYYPPEKRNDARMKMADIPQGATLIDNPVSAAPGFQLENVFVMAGVPAIMQAMFFDVKARLRGSPQMHTHSLHTLTPEGDLAATLAAIQADFPTVELGCYPHMRGGKFSTSLVLRGIEKAHVLHVAHEIHSRFAPLGVVFTEEC